jgi:hypothetical protein
VGIDILTHGQAMCCRQAPTGSALHAWTDCLGDGRFSSALLLRYRQQQNCADPADDQLSRSRWVPLSGPRIAGFVSYQGMQKAQ